MIKPMCGLFLLIYPFVLVIMRIKLEPQGWYEDIIGAAILTALIVAWLSAISWLLVS